MKKTAIPAYSPPPAEDERQLRRAVQELSILNELAREISASTRAREVIAQVVHRSIHAIQAEQGLIALVENPGSSKQKTFARSIQTDVSQVELHLDQVLLGWMQLNGKPLNLTNPCADEAYKHIPLDPNIRSLMCVPLFVKSELIGILIVFNKKDDEGFTADDQRLLTIIAAQSAQVIENARLLEHERELIAMHEELKLANKIQTELLPRSDPLIPGYDISGISIPAQVVGGDYYDFIALADSRLVICLGDVAGKGLPAALLMSSLQASVRSQLIDRCSPGECLRRVNYLLFRNTAANKFATLFFGLLDPRTHTLTYSLAGHEPPLWLRNNAKDPTLLAGGLGLGLCPETIYHEKQIQLEPADLLAVFSDGITETMNEHDEEFGCERLRQLLLSSREASARKLNQEIIDAVGEFQAQKHQHDDRTLVVIKRVT